MVLVQIETAVSSAGHKQIAVLGQVSRQPHRRLVCFFAEVREALGGVLRAHVVRAELGLERGHYQLHSLGGGRTRGGG